jgi:type I restriction enzyme S subunit
MTVSWPIVPLRRIISSLDAGVSVNAFDEPVRFSSEAGVLKVSCVSEGRFLANENKRVFPRDIGRVAVSPTRGDIIISRANTCELVGASGYVEQDHPNLFLSDKLWRVRLVDPDRDSPRWLIAILNSQLLRREFYRRATGTSGSMKNISKEAMLAIRIPRPSGRVQVKLGQVFEKLDRQMELLAEFQTQRLAFKRGLMQQLLTGRRRFHGFRYRPWVEVHLGDVFAERNETGRSDLPLLSVTHDRGVIPRDELDRRDTSNPDKTKYKRVAVGDIAYNTMRMWQGVSALSALEGIVSPAYTVVVPTERILGGFAKHLFKHPPVVNLFHRHSQGLVDDTLNLKFDRFVKIKLRIPADTDEQSAIARLLDLCDVELELIAVLRDETETFRRSLLSRLLSGSLRVPE